MAKVKKVKEVFVRPSWWPKGHKDNTDHSISFKCVGGKMHGNVVRLYEPFDAIVFPYPSGPERYELLPPSKVDGKWVLVHTPEVTNVGSE